MRATGATARHRLGRSWSEGGRIMGHEGAPRRRVRGSHRLAVVTTTVVMAAGSVFGTGLAAGANTKAAVSSSGFAIFGIHLGDLFGNHKTFKPPTEDKGDICPPKPPYDHDGDDDDDPPPCHHHHHHHHHHDSD